jgi:hypothetical protein
VATVATLGRVGAPRDEMVAATVSRRPFRQL